ncbi:hypothetical protein THAOC_26675, partial [Thalassiosira oceanica]
MIRPLQSLDAYSDDYYHLSLLNLAMGVLGARPGRAAGREGRQGHGAGDGGQVPRGSRGAGQDVRGGEEEPGDHGQVERQPSQGAA